MCKLVIDFYTKCSHQETWTDKCVAKRAKKPQPCTTQPQSRAVNVILCAECMLITTDSPTSIDEEKLRPSYGRSLSLILRDAETQAGSPSRSLRSKAKKSLHEASTGLNRGLHHASKTTKGVFRATFGGPLDVLKTMDGALGHDGTSRVKVKKADADRPRPRPRSRRTTTRDWMERQIVPLLSKIR